MQVFNTTYYSNNNSRKSSFLFFKQALLFSLLFLTPLIIKAQNDTCANAEPFCTDSGVSFPANSDGTGNGNGPQAEVLDPGNEYGCLGTTGNPAWFYIEIDNPGVIIINLSNSNALDIDFALWGPFSSIANASANCNSLPAPIDCSYTTDATETVNVPNSSTGDVYLLLVTNYANQPTDIIAAQSGGGGSTDCTIIPPCTPEAGTITTSTTGTGTGTNNLVLCVGDNFSLTSNDDYSLPPNQAGEESELMYAVYDCAPPAIPDPTVDACFSGLFWTGEDLAGTDPGATNDNGGIPSGLTGAGIVGANGTTIWYIPVTVDDGDNNSNPNGVISVDQNGDGCFDVGTPIEVTYLEDITVTADATCDPATSSGSVTFTISGGAALAGMGNFTITNSTGGGTTVDNTSVPDGGTTTVSTVTDGQTASITITDANGCSYGAYTFDFSCGDDACLINSTLTANPPPSDFPNNQYPPGTVVEFCFTIDQYNQTNINFLHGIVPSFSGAWDGPAMPTINPSVAANNEAGSNWSWLSGNTVNINTTGALIPDPGWWFFSANTAGGLPSDTNDSWGDGCSAICYSGTDQTTCILAGGTWIPGCGCTSNQTTAGGNPSYLWVGPDPIIDDIVDFTITQTSCENAGGVWDPAFSDCGFWGACLGNADDGFGLTWTACFTLTASVSCSPEETMDVSIKTYADGETGIWTDLGCTVDQPVIYDGMSICCLDAPIAASPVTFCEGDAMTITASTNTSNSPGGGATPGANTINWYDVATGGIPLAVGTTSYSPTSLAPGNYTFYAEEDDNGCLSTRTPVVLNVDPLPSATFDPVNQNICLGESITLVANVSDGVIASWTGEGTSGTGNSQTVTPTSSQTYSVTLNSTLGCNSVTVPIPITVNPLPSVTFDPVDQNVCLGESITLVANVSDGVIASWTGEGTSGTGNSQTVTPTSSQTYSVTVNSTLGCNPVTESISITVNSLSLDIGSDLTLCEGQTAYLGAVATGAPPYTYVWDNSLGTGSSHSVLVGTTDITYTVTVTDANTCTATDEVTVFSTANVAPVIACPPNQNVNNDATLCSANVVLADPTVTDDCAPPTLTASNGVVMNYYGMYNGHYYYVTQQNMTPISNDPSGIPGTTTESEAFAAVQAAAQEFASDSYIATIDDAMENDFITNIGYHYGNVIIGLTDELFEGLMGWVGTCGGCGGSGSGFFNWNAGEPNNIGEEDYVELQVGNGGWNDIDLNLSIREAVIEFNTMPQPTIECTGGTNPFPVGTTILTCTATDWAGNIASCMYDIVVADNESPVPACQDISIDVSSGSITIMASDIDNGSADNCGVQSMSLSEDTFDCTNEGPNTVTLTVTDVNGNTATCDATVTIQAIDVGFIKD